MDTGCGAERQDKHMDIVGAIDRLSYAVSQLADLNRRIKEGNVPRCEGECQKTGPIPTLVEVLNSAPEQIQAQTDMIRKLTEEIESQLF